MKNDVIRLINAHGWHLASRTVVVGRPINISIAIGLQEHDRVED